MTVVKFLSLPVKNIPFVITPNGRFGVKRGENRSHEGVDVRAPMGTSIYSVRDGTVIKIVRDGVPSQQTNICGNGVVILHKQPEYDREYTTTYCHLSTINVTEDQVVPAGFEIGKSGDSGNAKGQPHLHFTLKDVFGLPDRGIVIGLKDRPKDPTGALYALVNSDMPISTKTATVEDVPQSRYAISPEISSILSFHPKIQYELTRRRLSTEMANTYMPFVKLTSLTVVDPTELPDGVSEAWCPSLGIHGLPEESFDNIYLPKNNRSIIGYATTNAERDKQYKKTEVVVKTQSEQRTDGAFVITGDLSSPYNVPIPGITEMNMERGTAGPMGIRGGLTKATIKIVAYSIKQTDTLLKYFLRPGTRVMLELGRTQSKTYSENSELKVFDWNRSLDDIREHVNKLINNKDDEQTKFIDDHIYDSYGNYEIFIGYVVTFKLKYTKNNTYEIELTVHSVQQYELPTKNTGYRSTCSETYSSACRAADIQTYFDDRYSWMDNSFNSLLTEATNPSSPWAKHVIAMKRTTPNKTVVGTRRSGEGNSNEGGGIGAYYVSWRFFTEQILRNPRNGLLSIFDAGEDQTILNNAFLQVVDTRVKKSKNDKLTANEVAYHPDLRSTNPGIMIIYNKTAQDRVNSTGDFVLAKQIANADQKDNIEFDETNVIDLLIQTGPVGSFENIESAAVPNATPLGSGIGRLTDGIWISTNIIREAFLSTDTVSAAINWLLVKMNNSTAGYWNLQLLSAERGKPGLHTIDTSISKNVTTEKLPIHKEELLGSSDNQLSSKLFGYEGKGKENNPKYIYVFNRKLKTLSNIDDDISGELLDLNIDFNLPQVIAVQAIAGVSGVAEKSTLQSIDIEELNRISLIPDLYLGCFETDQNEGTTTICKNDPIQVLKSTREAVEEQLKEVERRATRATVDAVVTPGKPKEGTRTPQAQPGIRDADTPVMGLPSTAVTYGSRTPDQEIKSAGSLRKTLNELNQQILTQENPNLVNLVREYGFLGNALKYIEYNPTQMMKKLNKDSTNDIYNKPGSKIHSFNSSNLTKTIVDLTMPGIGGIELFQSFIIDRVPSIYERGFYVVTKVTHNFTPQMGWTTQIQGRFRFSPDFKFSI